MEIDRSEAAFLLSSAVCLGICLAQTKNLVNKKRVEKKNFVFDKPKGVPKKFEKADPNEPKWTNSSFMLASFQGILMCIRKPEDRSRVIQDLDAITTKVEKDGVGEDVVNGEKVSYLRTRLGYTIFREVTGEPYGWPKYECFVKVQDIVNRNFLGLIHKGIQAYEEASPEVRAKFNKAVMPRVKKGNVATQNVPQQSNVR